MYEKLNGLEAVHGIPGIKSSSFEELGGLDVKLGAALEELYVR